MGEEVSEDQYHGLDVPQGCEWDLLGSSRVVNGAV